MQQNAGKPEPEVQRLQRCMSDLVSVLALRAALDSSEPNQILSTFLDALLKLLDLDFAYAQAAVASDAAPLEIFRTADSNEFGGDKIRDALHKELVEDFPDGPSAARRFMGAREFSVLPHRLGIGSGLGLIIAGCQRPNFPQETERLVISVAANQIAVMLQQAQFVNEQKRVSLELNQHVAQRTAELAATNEELKKENAERKKIEEHLGQALGEIKKSEAKLRRVIDTIPTLSWCNLPDGSNEFLSKGWHEYTGLSPEEANGWGWQAAFHPDDLPPLMKRWQELLISGEPGEIESRLCRFDGVYRWFLIRVEPYRDETGTIVRWYGTSTDIEDRKHAEQELLRKEAFLTKAQRLSATGSFSWCVETDEIAFSEEACRIFGFEPGGLVTFELMKSRIHPEDLLLLAERAEAARKTSEGQDYEIRLLMSDGSLKYLHTTSNETRDLSGRREYIGAIQDVTQRRLAQESLNKARSELAHVSRVTSLGALTASMAHEINQPLSGIITNANTCLRMLSADPPNIDGARETARRTIRDGNRASNVITRLRTLFSKKEVAAEDVDLNEAAREVVTLLLNELQRNKAILHYELADRLPIVQGDRIQLQQVILNLIRNASDAMSGIEDRPRRLLIRTEQLDEDVCLAVQDSGIGFDGAIADRLFESFYTTKPKGMGIGLSVSRSIIEAHHGRLWAKANEGPGATFAFSIPCDIR